MRRRAAVIAPFLLRRGTRAVLFGVPRIFCEPSAVSPLIQRLQSSGAIEVITEPGTADPARAWEIRDLNLKGTMMPGAYAEYQGSAMFERILSVIGFTRRREGIWLDVAYQAGCAALVTGDSDLLRRAPRIEQLLGLRVLHPLRDDRAIEALAG